MENTSYLFYCISEKLLTQISVVCSRIIDGKLFRWEKVGFSICCMLIWYHAHTVIPQGFFTCWIPEIYPCIHLKRVWPELLNNKLCAVPFMCIQKEASVTTSLKTTLIYIQWNISMFLFLLLHLYLWKYSLFTAEALSCSKFSFKQVICP